MGQIFYACVYDIDSMTCSVIDADKFHANCYSFCGTVLATHYLLRQKPWRVMWGGHYVLVDNVIEHSSREDLLGLSTFIDYKDIELDNDGLPEHEWSENARFIAEHSKLWKRIDVWNDALEYFDWDNTQSVRYQGYLLNLTKKLAVDLTDYYIRSLFMLRHGRRTDDGEYVTEVEPSEIAAIDLIPVLTETGGGTSMLFFEGLAWDSTEELSMTWCGDLLQIVEELPGDYQLIKCCFAEFWDRAFFCQTVYGTDEAGFLLGTRHGNRYMCATYDFTRRRGAARYVKVERDGGKLKFVAKPISQFTEEKKNTHAEKDS